MPDFTVPPKFNALWVGLSPTEKVALAAKAGAAKVYLTHVAFGHSRPSPALARRIGDALGSDYAKELRPDVFG